MSEFGIRNGLLIEKLPAEKMGALVIPQTRLKKAQSSGFFYVKGREKERGKR